MRKKTPDENTAPESRRGSKSRADYGLTGTRDTDRPKYGRTRTHALTRIFGMHDDPADGVLDFVGILPVDVMFPDGDGVVGRIAACFHAMTRR